MAKQGRTRVGGRLALRTTREAKRQDLGQSDKDLERSVRQKKRNIETTGRQPDTDRRKRIRIQEDTTAQTPTTDSRRHRQRREPTEAKPGKSPKFPNAADGTNKNRESSLLDETRESLLKNLPCAKDSLVYYVTQKRL